MAKIKKLKNPAVSGWKHPREEYCSKKITTRTVESTSLSVEEFVESSVRSEWKVGQISMNFKI